MYTDGKKNKAVMRPKGGFYKERAENDTGGGIRMGGMARLVADGRA